MLVVPLKPVANQTLAVLLNNQSCQLNIYQKTFGLFMDVYVSNEPIICGVICLNYNRIVRSLYLGFQGDFWFADTQSVADVNGLLIGNDPIYTGLGSRYILEYLVPSDLPAGVG